MRSAKLEIRNTNVSIEGLRIYWIQDITWQENALTWNNAPLQHNGTSAAGDHPASTTIEIDVSWIVSGNGVYTIGLVATDKPGQKISSRENIIPPSLVVEF